MAFYVFESPKVRPLCDKIGLKSFECQQITWLMLILLLICDSSQNPMTPFSSLLSPLTTFIHLFFMHFSLFVLLYFFFHSMCPITNDNDDRGQRLGCIQVISSLRYFFFFYSLFTLMAFFLLRLCPCMAASLTNDDNRGLRL